MQLTQERLKELLSYDPLTGGFLWLRSRCGRVGHHAGGQRPYSTIKIDGKSYLSHRLAWLYAHGSPPADKDIDHINGDPSDNRIANLRLASHSQNLANQKINKNNSTGFKGVIPSRKRFRARIRINRTVINLGVFDTPEAAHAEYFAKAQELYGQFARAS